MKILSQFTQKIHKHPFPIFLLLVLLAALFRIPNLNTLPSGFFGDEAALAYNAWSILETGKDEWGVSFPLTLRSFDDYKPALYTYLTIPFVALRGLTHEAARLPAAVSGSLLPGLVFLLLFDKKNTKKSLIGILSALVLCVTPWHWEVSRTAIEAGVAVTLTVALLVILKYASLENIPAKSGFLQKLHATLVTRFTRKKSINTTQVFSKKSIFLFLIALILGCAILFTYHTARLIMPILLIAGAVLSQFKTNWAQKFLLLFFVIAGFGLALTASSARYSQISLFTDPGVGAKRTEASNRAGVAGISAGLTHLYHNKPISWMQTYLDSYLTNTSFTYLFIGSAQPVRASIPETGQFLWIFLPFFIMGIIASVRSATRFDLWLGFWLLLSPAAASLTTAEIPHVYRTLFLLVPIAIYIGMGIYWSFELVSQLLQQIPLKKPAEPTKKSLILITLFFYGALLLLTVTANTAKAWHQFSVQQALSQPWYRQYGYKELYSYLSTLSPEEASHITITNREMEPYIFYLFYNQVHPSIYQSQPNKRLSHDDIHFNGAREWTLFNMTFSEEKCPYDGLDIDPTHLYVVGLNCTLPTTFERVRNINFKDGVPMFHIDRPKPSNLDTKTAIQET